MDTWVLELKYSFIYHTEANGIISSAVGERCEAEGSGGG